jgi:hypothetical protein
MTDLTQALANSKSDDCERGEPTTTSIQPLPAHSGANAELCREKGGSEGNLMRQERADYQCRESGFGP